MIIYYKLICISILFYSFSHAAKIQLVQQIFDFMIRDFSKFALQLYSKPNSTTRQKRFCMMMIQKPAVNDELFRRMWDNHVYTLKDQKMNREFISDNPLFKKQAKKGTSK